MSPIGTTFVIRVFFLLDLQSPYPYTKLRTFFIKYFGFYSQSKFLKNEEVLIILKELYHS